MTVPERLIEKSEYDSLREQIERQSTEHAGKTGVVPLANGQDAFLARLAMIDSADDAIDLQYYIYHPDETGHALTWALLKAADRGVQVRVLLDDLYASPRELGITTLSQHINVEVRLFNPFAHRYFKGVQLLRELRRVNRRMHNKSLTIDRQITLVGGRNIGDEYFGADESLSFGDFDVIAIGQAVEDIHDQFELYWNSPQVYPVTAFIKQNQSIQQLNNNKQWLQDNFDTSLQAKYLSRLDNARLLKNLMDGKFDYHWAEAKTYYDLPEKVTDDARPSEIYMIHQLLPHLATVQKRLVLISPYFVPGKVGMAELTKLAMRGVEVVVITNSLAATDVVAVHSGYQKYRFALLNAGIKVYEIKVDPKNKPGAWKGSRRASLHAKCFCADDRLVFVGSFNFDPRSSHLNTELGLVIDSTQMAQVVFADLQHALIRASYRLTRVGRGQICWHDDLHGVDLYHEPDAGIWRRLAVRLLSLFNLERFL